MRIILKLIKIFTIGIIWTYIFAISSNAIMIILWNFSIFSASDWHKINAFWTSGGIIKDTKDYFFLFSIVCLLPLWLYLYTKLCKLNYLNILIFPIIIYNKIIINRYGNDSKRIILKNMQPTSILIEKIKNDIESIKPEEANKSNEIRGLITDKLNKLNK